MRKLLVVSPHFPPVNAPDMHRVRMSLSHYREFGWDAAVLAVEPRHASFDPDPFLVRTVPRHVPVLRVPAVPERWARIVGVGNVALRAAPWLHRAGAWFRERWPPDLVYFSTTQFPAMALGRVWKRRYGWPFVLDMQDPWVNDHSPGRDGRKPSLKGRLMDSVHRILEPWTMRAADGLTAVTGDYLRDLRLRHPRLRDVPAATLPFGAAEADFRHLNGRAGPRTRLGAPGNAFVHGVYAGRGGPAMRRAGRIVLRALRLGLRRAPDLFLAVRWHAVGTDYAPEDRARPTFAPLAAEEGVADHVDERPARVPYGDALRLLRGADFLLLPGSDDPRYTASKIFPCILARRPLLGVFHEASSVVEIVRRCDAGRIVTFSDDPADDGRVVEKLYRTWAEMLDRLPFEPSLDRAAFDRHTARHMTRRQCELFDEVLTDGDAGRPSDGRS